MQLSMDDLRYTELSLTEVEERDGLARPGDLLFTRYNGNVNLVGACARVPDKSPAVAYPDKLIRVSLSPQVDSRFLCFAWSWTETRKQLKQHVKTTAGQAGISGTSLKSILLPVPPLAEQHRIVEALEDHLSRLVAAQSSLRDAHRRSLSLLQRLAATAIAADPDAAHATTLGSVAKRVKNGIFVSRPGSEPNGVPILRIGAVRPMKLKIAEVRYTGLAEDAQELKDSLLDPGDLLFTRYNGNPEYVGACTVVPDSMGKLTYPDKLVRVTVDSRVVLPTYAALSCSTGPARQYIRQRVKTTAGQAGISGRELKNVPLLLPSVEEQQRRIQYYSAAAESVERMQQEVEDAQARGSHLRKAVLHRAFTGTLVPQDPTDEPASVLLDRIRAEREAQAQAQAGAKARKAKRTPRPRKAATADVPPPPPPPTTSSPAPTAAVQQELPL